ncbi:hypothetical protein ILYODFUR_032482 [Ilyodon furcidens]|uniref:Uncharacterized protein n=1 Tax=Ilyodon furcidens TaxID=33524 RepID=A0ABV0TNM3_9TELE
MNLLHYVVYCIRSTLPGGELSGIFFVLHSLKGSAAGRQSMVRVGVNVKPIPTSHPFPFTVSFFILPTLFVNLTVLDAACADFVIALWMLVWITHDCLNVSLHASSQPIMFPLINVFSLTHCRMNLLFRAAGLVE